MPEQEKNVEQLATVPNHLIWEINKEIGNLL